MSPRKLRSPPVRPEVAIRRKPNRPTQPAAHIAVSASAPPTQLHELIFLVTFIRFFFHERKTLPDPERKPTQRVGALLQLVNSDIREGLHSNCELRLRNSPTLAFFLVKVCIPFSKAQQRGRLISGFIKDSKLQGSFAPPDRI